MNPCHPHCVIPAATEQELAVLPGPQPGTALRVRLEPGQNGYVRLEQLAYNVDLGWYSQKSFCIPGEMLSAIIAQLRKADCLIPRNAPAPRDSYQLFPLPTPSEDSFQSTRRGA